MLPARTNETEEPASGAIVAEICVACVFDWAENKGIEGDQFWMTEYETKFGLKLTRLDRMQVVCCRCEVEWVLVERLTKLFL